MLKNPFRTDIDRTLMGELSENGSRLQFERKHVIKAIDRKPARNVPFDEAGGQIKGYLAQERRQQRAEAFVDELKKKARIEVLI